MDIFDVLTTIGGICLFLFGMNLMGDGLERAAGSGLRSLLSKLTSNRFLGFLTGMIVTAVIQASAATTVMVVGFVNSGLMNLAQAIGVIMGANIGTTITAWIFALGGIEGDSLFAQLLKPTSFTPVLALIGILLHMFAKSDRKKNIGTVLLGFAVLMFGMNTMTESVKGLKDEAWFTNLFLTFENPLLGVLAGAVLTALIQSSSASVGILQALSATGSVSIAATIPIIMGQNIGTTVTSLISSVGTNKNAQRAAVLHAMFNIVGTLLILPIFWIVKEFVEPAFLNVAANHVSISVCHTAFNVVTTAILFPCANLLVKLVCKLVPDSKEPDTMVELDERLLVTPPAALQQCRKITLEMADSCAAALSDSLACLTNFSKDLAASVREKEALGDHYEDILSSYMVKLSAQGISESDQNESAMLLKAVGDFERISDHSVNLIESAEEMQSKKDVFSDAATKELKVLLGAVQEITELSVRAFRENNLELARQVESLEQVIDDLKEQMRTRHILRLQQGGCKIETGFVWSDLLTNLERIGDHCSNIAGCVIDMQRHDMNIHENVRSVRTDSAAYLTMYGEYSQKYSLNG